MNIDAATLRQVAGELAALDFSAENERIAELEAKIAHAEGVMQSTRQRIVEIRATLSDRKGPEPWKVAAELLDGTEPTTAALAAPSTEALEAEREALTRGLQGIHQQITDWKGFIQQVRHEAAGRMRPTAQPLVDEIIEIARLAAEEIVSCFAALKAVNLASTAGTYELGAVAQTMAAAMDGSAGRERLIPARNDVAVPPEIVAALRGLAGKGPAIKSALVTRASIR